MRGPRCWLGCLAVAWLLLAGGAEAADRVSLQLRWDHQFQFAGYHAARWQGYYAEAGLDVEIRSIFGPDGALLAPTDEVAAGRADFGIGAADILIARDRGAPLVVLASIFQKSAAALVALAGTPLEAPADLLALRVGRRAGDLIDVEMQAMLRANGIDPGRVPSLGFRPGFGDLVERRIDVAPGYAISAPVLARQLGLTIRTLRPSEHGVDFYGDSLFTTERLAASDPDLVERFVRASLEGWRYALAHPEEVADRIARELPAAVTMPDPAGFNRQQAPAVRELVRHGGAAVGRSDPERWAEMQRVLAALGLVRAADLDVERVILDPTRLTTLRAERRTRLVARGTAAMLVAFGATLAWVLLLRRRIRVVTHDLRASEQRFRDFARAGSDWFWETDARHRFVWFSPNVEDLTGVPRAWHYGKSRFEIMAPDVDPAVIEAHRRALDAHEPFHDFEFLRRGPTGDRWLSSSGVPVFDAVGRFTGYRGTGKDITARKTAELALRESEARLDAVVDTAVDGILTIDHRGIVLTVNRAAVRIFGYAPEEMIGRNVSLLMPEPDRSAHDSYLDHYLRTGDRRIIGIGREVHGRRKDGSIFPLDLAVSEVRLGERRLFTGVVRDITERKRVEQELLSAHARLEELALHDPLTGLPNRRMLADRVGRALAWARRERSRVAVMALDLDRFKQVNDTLGHEAGDDLLRQVAERITALVRGTDTVARLGGDEFVLLQTGVHEPGAATAVATLAERVVAELGRPFEIAGRTVTIGTSVGISLFPDDGDAPDDLLRHADLALYRAKAQGRGRASFYTPALSSELEARRSVGHELKRALEGGELGLIYQPVLDLATERVDSVEALVRWCHPERGLLTPATFLPAAEAGSLIQPIGAFALAEACAQALRWHQAGRALRVSLHLSPAELSGSYLEAALRRALGTSDVPPDLLELEVSEGRLDDAAAEVLRQAAALGVGLAVGDVGTGAVPLARLERLPVRRLKIDGALVAGIGRSREHESLIRAVVALGRSLGKQVVAKGVETRSQLMFLRAAGCDEGQGRLWSPPIAAEEIGRRLAA